MKQERSGNYWSRLFFQMLFHPIFLVVYGLAWFYLSHLFWYGASGKYLPLLILCGLFFLLYLVLFFVRGFTGHVQGGLLARGRIWRMYRVFAAVALAAITLIFGVQTAQGYQESALAQKLEDLTNQRTIIPSHTNLFETGLDGLLADVGQAMPLPEELYLGDELNLLFDEDGSLRSLYTYLYGRGEDGQTQSFQLAYDRDVSEQLTIYLLEISTEEYPASRSLTPLLDTLNHLDLRSAIRPLENCGYDAFELWYSGLEEWKDPGESLYYLDSQGAVLPANVDSKTPVVNYGVSLCLPDLEAGDELEDSRTLYRPQVYIYVEDFSRIESSNEAAEKILEEENQLEGEPLLPSA